MYDQITVMAKELYEKSVALRRDLHRHPETGWLEMRNLCRHRRDFNESGL